MFVCLCNAISDTDLRQAAENGAKDVDSAYRYFGAEVQCGRCRQTAEQVLAENPQNRLKEQKTETYWLGPAVQAAD